MSGATTTTTLYVGGLEQDTTTQSANTSSTTRTQFYYANGQRLAVSTNGTLFFLASDGLGSTQLALDSSGTPMGSQLYAPYGSVRYSNGTLPLDYGFTGQHSDSVTGLDYYNARYYDPVAGQFTSADSVLAGLNRYSYVHNNPETATDPSGHVECMGGECETGGGGDPENAGGGDFVAGDVVDASLTPLEQSQIDSALQQMEAGEVDAGWQETGTGIDLPDAGVNDAIDSATTEGERTANAEFNTQIGSDQTEAPSTSLTDVVDSSDVRLAQEGETPQPSPTEPTDPTSPGGAGSGGSGAPTVPTTAGSGSTSSGAATQMGAGSSTAGSGTTNMPPGRPSVFPPDFNDSTQSPGPDWQWKPAGNVPGTDPGSWTNDSTKESWHPDLGHGPPWGPHWDYSFRGMKQFGFPGGWRWTPWGGLVPK